MQSKHHSPCVNIVREDKISNLWNSPSHEKKILRTESLSHTMENRFLLIAKTKINLLLNICILHDEVASALYKLLIRKI